MQNHGHYSDDYDGGGYGYGSPGSSRGSSAQFGHFNNKHPAAQANDHYDDFDFRQSLHEHHLSYSSQAALPNGDHFDDFKFHNATDDQVASHHISLNTNVRDQNHDVVGRHLLYETALLDTQSFEILDMSEVDELKKEHARLNQRIEAASRKLALESKVKNAAQNLQRLYSSSKKDARPDTPQSPDSPRRSRNSLLGNRGRTASGAQTLQQAGDELAQSIKKVDDLNDQIKALLERRQEVERRLLRHTAAVLAEQASQPSEHRTDALANQHRGHDLDELYLPGPDEFDGIRDILRGNPAPSSKQLEKITSEHETAMTQMHDKLEHLNAQLRDVINTASQARGQAPAPETSISTSSDPANRLSSTISNMEVNLRTLEQQQATNLHQDGNVGEQLRVLNSQVYQTLQSSGAVQQPPRPEGQDYEQQLEYLEQSLSTIDQLIRNHHNELQGAKEASSAASREVEDAAIKADTHAKRTDEYETVLAGLWDIVSAEPGVGDTNGDGSRSTQEDRKSLKDNFSLQAFSSRVQHLFDVATGAKEQQDILRRQIQQQRELNGKSDAEKDTQMNEIQGRYDQLRLSYDAVQQDLANSMASQEQAEREVTESRNEMANVMDELEHLKRTIDETKARQAEVDSRHAQMSTEKDAADERHTEIQKQLEEQESEVVRLVTELTIARAELEAAHGTRSERQKEAGVAAEEMQAQMDALRREHGERAKLLEQELQDMTNEFQEMTRESLEMEKERGQLDGVIDGLRDRCDQLEAQLNDERIKWMGIKSPGDAPDGGRRENTSVMVLRQEFKKMMREARVEGVRLLRAEQEERRKLEAELRKLRHDTGPMARHNSRQLHVPSPSNASSTTPMTNGVAHPNGDTLSPLRAAAPASGVST